MSNINKDNYSKENPINNNGILNANKNQYDDKILEVEKNSFNIYNNSNSLLKNEKFNSIEVLKKLDMVHPINNYYNNMVEPPNNYKVFIRPDAKHDFGNFAHFNDYVKFDPKKYKRSEIYYGYVHDQYIVPHILLGKVENDKKKENEKNDDLKDIDKNMKIDSKKIKNKGAINKKEKGNAIKSLDDIMNKYNLKYIEPPPKEKKVEPPPEEIPPEEEEENKDNKDKNKGKKESANKSKNTKDDKIKSGKPTKK